MKADVPTPKAAGSLDGQNKAGGGCLGCLVKLCCSNEPANHGGVLDVYFCGVQVPATPASTEQRPLIQRLDTQPFICHTQRKTTIVATRESHERLSLHDIEHDMAVSSLEQ